MNKAWVNEQLRNLDFRIWMNWRLVFHWFKIKLWLPVKHWIIDRHPVYTRIGFWEYDGKWNTKKATWKMVPKWAPFWFGRKYHGYLFHGSTKPIEAASLAEANAKHELQMAAIERAVASAEVLLAKMQEMSKKRNRSYVEG